MLHVINNLNKLCSGRLLPVTGINLYLSTIDPTEFRQHVDYNIVQPKRKLLHNNDRFALQTIGFLPGQRLPIQYYDPFNVFFTVVQGKMVENVFIKNDVDVHYYTHRIHSGRFINDRIANHGFANKTNYVAGLLVLYVI
jgi:hypothetical protein